MTTTTFDKHEVYRHIKAAGLTDQQTDSLFEAIKVAHSSSELATKGDLMLAMKELEYKLTIRICGIMTGVIFAGVGFIAWFIENHSKI